MGNCLPPNNSNQNKVQVWYLNEDRVVNVPSSMTLKQLKLQLNNINKNPKFIFYDWSPINDKDEMITLLQIIQKSSKICQSKLVNPNVFTVINSNESLPFQSAQKNQTRHQKILKKLQAIQSVDKKKVPQIQMSKSGRIMFEGRQSALFASSVNMALQKSNPPPQKLQALLQNNKKHEQSSFDMTIIGKLFQKIHLIGNGIVEYTQQHFNNLIQSLKLSKEFSDFDPKFVYYLGEIYFKFMIQSKGKLQYIDYNKVEDFQIEYISSKSKIGILGDYGTGLKDSIELLRNMIVKHQVDVILHLGDVYYAGTPKQYQDSIVKPLNQLRLQTNRQIRFYQIPGNHDYYSWGLPYLCFVKGINQKQFQRQKASYYCIRDKSNKWQFLGMDSAVYDSNPLNQIFPWKIGPFVQEKQLPWHYHRLENFSGSTFLMTHHQLFSIHERINGKISKYRNFSCINPMLCAQLFKYMGNISAWFWGHEHSLMLFKDNLFGLPKGRLLGNSSFHVVFEKQNPYARQQGFPYIPFIVEDKQYLQKYLPINPNTPVDDYFGLSYAFIDMGKIDNDGNLPIQYWCCASYSNEEYDSKSSFSTQKKKKLFFDEYKLYEQKLLSIDSLKKQRQQIKNNSKVYLRCQIGLALKIQNQNKEKLKQLVLTLSASQFEIQIFDQKSLHNHQIIEFALKSTEVQNLYLAVVNNNQVKLVQIKSKQDMIKCNAVWICQNMCVEKNKINKNENIFYGQPVKIQNKNLQKSLTWQIFNNDAYPMLEEPQYPLSQQQLKVERVGQQNMESLWMFEKQNLIKE